MVRKCLQVSVEKCRDYLQRGENKGGLLSLWCLCPGPGEWCCRMAGLGWGSKGPGKQRPERRQTKARRRVWGWPSIHSFSGKSSVAKRKHRQLEHTGTQLHTCQRAILGKRRTRTWGKRAWRDGDKETEINRIWKCTGHETEGTQMQMQRERGSRRNGMG